MDPLKIIIADDHPFFRIGIEKVLYRINRSFTIYQAASGGEVLELLGKHPVDLLFMDIRMPGSNGIEVTRQIRKTNSVVKVIALSMMDDRATVLQMLEAGGNGYLLKNIHQKQLRQAIEVVMNGCLYLSDDIAGFDKNISIDGKAISKYDIGDAILSPREIEILQLICGQYPTHEIAKKLQLTLKAIESHRHHLMIKTNSKNMAGLIVYAVQKNYFPHEGG